MNDYSFYSMFLISTQVVYRDCCLVITCLVPRRTAAVLLGTTGTAPMELLPFYWVQLAQFLCVGHFICFRESQKQRQRDTETVTHREKQRDRDREWETETESERQRQTERQRLRDLDQDRERQTETETKCDSEVVTSRSIHHERRQKEWSCICSSTNRTQKQ